MRKRNIPRFQWGEDPRLSGPRNYFRESLIIKAVKKYKKKGTILDAGCGTGSLSIRLAGEGYNLMSVDTARRSLNYLKSEVIAKRLGRRIRVQHKSIVHTFFKKQSFDVIVCGEVLEHIVEDRKVIAEFFRILKNDGYCIITVPADPKLWDSTDDIAEHKRRYIKDELEKKFKNQKFLIVKSFYWGFPLNYFWHKYVFTPFLINKLQHQNNVTNSKNIISGIIKNNMVNRLLSYVFSIDLIFRKTGNCLFLVAKKI